VLIEGDDMRHSRRTKKFDRYTAHRQAMLKNLARSLLISQKVKTTLVKAKEARRLIEKLITLGKEDTLKNRRLCFTYLQDRSLIKRLFQDIAPLFKDRPGGYTRILKTANRAGDGAQMAILELVTKKQEPKAEKKKIEKIEKTKEEKKIPPAKEPSKEEKPKPKPITREEPKPRERKKGFISGLRKYFGGRKKNK
jgi:large subunit ribosomal protein L17